MSTFQISRRLFFSLSKKADGADVVVSHSSRDGADVLSFCSIHSNAPRGAIVVFDQRRISGCE